MQELNKGKEEFNSDKQELHDERICEFGQAELESGNEKKIRLISIIGEIEGHECLPKTSKATKYEHLLPQLAEIEHDCETGGVLFLIHTAGGDVEAGLALAEMIASLSKPTVSLVLGGSHSIGIPLAVAAKTSFAVPSAAMTIHPVRMSGTVIAAPQTYNYFRRLQERIVTFVSGHSQVSAERFEALMMRKDDMAADVGSVLYGEEAVREGIIDAVGGLSDGLSCLYRMIDESKGRVF